jgi:hypothetical protein
MNSPIEKMEEGAPEATAMAVTGLQPSLSTAGTALATTATSQGVPMHQQEKQGSKCCMYLQNFSPCIRYVLMPAFARSTKWISHEIALSHKSLLCIVIPA